MDLRDAIDGIDAIDDTELINAIDPSRANPDDNTNGQAYFPQIS